MHEEIYFYLQLANCKWKKKDSKNGYFFLDTPHMKNDLLDVPHRYIFYKGHYLYIPLFFIRNFMHLLDREHHGCNLRGQLCLFSKFHQIHFDEGLRDTEKLFCSLVSRRDSVRRIVILLIHDIDKSEHNVVYHKISLIR